MRLVMYTLWGLYQTYPEILDNIELPEEMDKTTMMDYIFMYAGENEVRYSHPAVLERLVNRWFSSRKHDFERMWRALHAVYNPIENTDRYEDFWENTERTDKGTENRTEDNSVQRNSSGQNSQKSSVTGNSNSTGSSSGTSTRTPNLTSEETVSAFDADSYQPNKQTTQNGTETAESNEASTSNVSSTQNAEQSGNQSTNETETGNNSVNGTTTNTMHNELKHGLHSHGNIGVTTNQEMINEELELRRYDLYKQIALLFEDEFTVPVYERRCNEYGML